MKRLITRKQLQAIFNLMDYLEYYQRGFQSLDIEWSKLQDIKKLVRNGKINNLYSTATKTQNIFHFLISSVKKIENMSTEISSVRRSDPDRDEKLDCIQGESVYDGYWDNPLF